MPKSKIAGIGHYVPENVVTNHDLMEYMDTTNEWIVERTGINERRFATKHKETTSTMGTKAARIAIERAGITPKDIDFIIFATLSPDYFFPGAGVLTQRELEIPGVGALDIRNQCSGFVYALSIADQYIKSGMYKNILVIGSELHSAGLDFSTKGRNVSVIFGDGAGALVLQPTEKENQGIITTHLHADGRYAEELAYINPGCHGGYHHENGIEKFGYGDTDKFGGAFITRKMFEEEDLFPYMNGRAVFKYAATKFPEVILTALEAAKLELKDIDMLVPHQANLRISQFVQKFLDLPEEKVWNNIQKYGNTTAASIPIALCEAWEAGKIKEGDLVCLAAFGSGFTWASALLHW